MQLARLLAAALACAPLLAAAPAAPADARNTRSPAACVNLAHQLVHYDTMRERAAAARKALWVDRIDSHIELLEDRLAERCPDEWQRVRNDQQLAEFLKIAARGALSFFTLGAY